MIRAEHIQVGYDEKIVIKDLSLNIHKGEVVSILGPNGCGKSTLLKTLSRVLKPMKGSILVENNPIHSIGTKILSRKIAMLSQHNEAPAGITVKELVYYGRLPHKKWFETKNKEDETIIDWALTHTGLKDYKDRLVSGLSGGERQRVWLAMALAQKPEVLLLDEPTVGIDPELRQEIWEELRNQANQGKTILITTHVMDEAERCDVVLMLRNGKFIAEGSPNEIKGKYQVDSVEEAFIVAGKNLELENEGAAK